MPPIIQTCNLTRRFGSNTAVDNLSLTIERGEVFGILGPNGAGKSTLLSMLCTILKPTSGTATVNGFDILRQHHEVRKSIGIVFQDPSVDADMTGLENLQMHADLYNVPVSEVDTRIKSVLALVQLEDRAGDFLSTYSGGMRRRLEIARGLLHYPKVLFLDEPTIGLDPQSREHMWDHIRMLKKREDMTIILTTHYMEEADRLCDRVAIIDHGKIVALDQPSVLKNGLGGDTIILGTKDGQALYDLFLKTKVSDNVQVHNGEVRVMVASANIILPRIMEQVSAARIHIEYIYLNHPDMNDVFIHYTGKDLRHEQAHGHIGKMAMMRRRRVR
ncbi:MAG: ATP-binding cassette domain-containing protein [Methanoregula sp.]|jgi:ABC-2 type transport system ATP-binding protein|uniref:ATP-binding cassette domain-containing protein n=1 Tax=Methanoregula sp. TaxID=2052170 RepID=UPI0025F7A1D1|nr:ATP-binding cassette domain-containing protein [Methanoregula sp.]MCK9632382.1 ATP-binding cassette domain-containing protein [Methanoregula sp.]